MKLSEEMLTVLAITGVILIVFGAISVFTNLSFATTSVGTYYYYVPGVGNVTYWSLTTTQNTTQSLKVSSAWGTLNASVKVVFPFGSSGNITFRIANITSTQLPHFGAAPLPSGLIGKAYFDIMLNITYTGSKPTVYLTINVTDSNTRAYIWNATQNQWVYISGQTITPTGVNGIYELKIPLSTNLTGTPISLTLPAPVGGHLILHSKSGNLTLLLISAGSVMTSVALALWVIEKRKR